MKLSAVLLLAASASAAVMGKRFSNGGAIEAPRALDLAQDVRRAANTSSVVEARQAGSNATAIETRQVANATSPLDARQAGNATARSNLRRAAAANGTAAARSVDGKAHRLF